MSCQLLLCFAMLLLLVREVTPVVNAAAQHGITASFAPPVTDTVNANNNISRSRTARSPRIRNQPSAPLWGWTEGLLPLYETEVAKWRSVFSATTFVFCVSTGHVGTTSLSQIFNNATGDGKTVAVNEVYGSRGPKADSIPRLKKARNTRDGKWMWTYVLKYELII